MILCYLKPTNFCSVGCEHCYLTENVRADKSIMTEETLRNTALSLKNMTEKRRGSTREVSILWHGGEPLMLSPDYFFKSGELLDEILPGHEENIQTSLIPYSKKFERLVIERFGGGLGTSVDFSQRKINSSSDRYLDVFLRKANMARDAGIFVAPGMVPTRAEIGNESFIVNWFMENEFTDINIDRYNSFNGDLNEFLDKPKNSEHSEFLINLYEELVSRVLDGESPPSFKQVGLAIRGVLHGYPGDRWGTTCQSDFIVVEPDGSTNSCPDRSSREESFGSVNISVDSFLSSAERKKWIKTQKFGHMNHDCPTCEYSSWCKSGCPVAVNDIEKEGDCSGYKLFLTHVSQRMSKDSGVKAASIKIMEQL